MDEPCFLLSGCFVDWIVYTFNEITKSLNRNIKH